MDVVHKNIETSIIRSLPFRVAFVSDGFMTFAGRENILLYAVLPGIYPGYELFDLY